MAYIDARGLRKTYGATIALDGLDLRLEQGQILGLIGPNGAGKSTILRGVLGLTPCDGELTVLGRNPWAERAELMRDVAFIADVAILPQWLRVSQAIEYVSGVHPRFDRAKAEAVLAKSEIPSRSRIGALSKGMAAQLHLALVMAVDAKLLILDEPTLGLDIVFRKRFYDALLTDYFDASRSIVLATHQVDEVQDILTDILYVDRGRVVLQCSMDEFVSRYLEVRVRREDVDRARALGPLHERQGVGHTIFLFDRGNMESIAALGEARTPNIADLVIALSGDRAHSGQGAGT